MIKTDKILQTCNELISDLPKLRNPNEILVVGVDGPTAAGKTIFANHLADVHYSRTNKKSFIYRLDWTLKKRNLRLEDLDNLKRSGKPFHLEAELHMRLNELESFLKKVRNYNQNICDGNLSGVNFTTKLEKLYSREAGGELSDECEVDIAPGSLIIVEGHYSLRSDLHKYFDINALLLSNKNTLLNRKVARVSGYRSGEEAKIYFNLIDAPSFSYHLHRFRYNATHIIQNENFNDPRFEDQAIIDEWLNSNAQVNASVDPELNNSSLSIEKILNNFYTESIFSPKNYHQISLVVFNLLHLLDNEISKKIITSVDEQAVSLSQIIDDFISLLNVKCSIFTDEKLELKHANALHNVYFRTYPITIAVGIGNSDRFSILIDFYEEKIQLSIVWEGGSLDLLCKRALGQLHEESSYVWTPSEFQKDASLSIQEENVYAPANFTLPNFIDVKNVSLKIVGKEQDNISAFECLRKFNTEKICWIARFSLQSEAEYFKKLCNLYGGNAVVIGNFLVACKSPKFNTNFLVFEKDWACSIEDEQLKILDGLSYDQSVIFERKEMAEIIGINSFFKVLDTHIFLKVAPTKSNSHIFIGLLEKYLHSKNRLLRKRTCQFIERQFGSIELPVSKLWESFSSRNEVISLAQLINMQPTIMAEVYLWMSIREMSSAIMGANIYDTSENSLDAKGHIQAAMLEDVPIILQASLNALGPSFKGSKTGYLHPKEGARDLISSVMLAVRNLCIDDKVNPPIFGIGLDHIDSRNDIPCGRARKFLEDSIETGLITHVVLDGSSLFDAKNSSQDQLRSAYDKVASYEAKLVEGLGQIIMIDKEICIGELNYIGAERVANIPSAFDINLFVQKFKSNFRRIGLGSFLRRPLLFIGNVGTTHHSGDVGEVKSEVAGSWVKLVKKDLFVSAVLHGTTGTESRVLKNSLIGCKKVNIAGDFLGTYLNSLPKDIAAEINSFDSHEPKRGIYKVAAKISKLPDGDRLNISESITDHSRRIIRTIKSPVLTVLDKNFFRYSPYIFSTKEINQILKEVETKIDHEIPEQEFKAKKISDFSASLIEVPFGENFIDISERLSQLGVINYHIDVGDGDLISREFSGIIKIGHLRKLNDDIKISTHLMVRNPHIQIEKINHKSYIQSYAEAGSDRIAIHLKAVANKEEAKECFNLIRKFGKVPGIVIEVEEAFSPSIQSIISENKIDWLIVMGVPIGYGGQIFNSSVLSKISSIRKFALSSKLPILIEVDGGLTLSNIRACNVAGADIFAGWSIIKPDSTFSLEQKVILLMQNL
jgi:ribulose-phosphate 3-epimerase